jgi:hypothetical protein
VASYCVSCGSPLTPSSSFCAHCGTRVGDAAPLSRGTSGSAIASLVLGIAGFVGFPLLGAVLAIILGRKAKREIAAQPGLGGQGLAQAGEVLGWIGIGFAVLLVFMFVIALGTLSHSNM